MMKKILLEKGFLFIAGVISGILIALLLYPKPKIINEPYVIAYKPKKGKIEKPTEIKKIIVHKYDTVVIKPNWNFFVFEDSVIWAGFEAKTDSVANFSYEILHYPEVQIIRKIVEKHKPDWLFHADYVYPYSFGIGLGYKFIHLGVISDYKFRRYNPYVGLYFTF